MFVWMYLFLFLFDMLSISSFNDSHAVWNKMFILSPSLALSYPWVCNFITYKMWTMPLRCVHIATLLIFSFIISYLIFICIDLICRTFHTFHLWCFTRPYMLFSPKVVSKPCYAMDYMILTFTFVAPSLLTLSLSITSMCMLTEYNLNRDLR